MPKLDRPPHVQHWVRYNFPDLDRTKMALVRFMNSFPTISYAHALKLIGDRLQFHTDWQTLMTSASIEGRCNSRQHCRELLEAFQTFEAEYDFAGLKAFDFELSSWKISRSISVPVRPLTTLLQSGQLEPVFVFGWASFPLSDYQIRLLMTIIEDAVFTLSEYTKSEGHFIVFPRNTRTGVREARFWKRGDYALLSQNEVQDQVDIYLEALDFARNQQKAEKGLSDADHTGVTPDPRQFRMDF